MTRVSVITGGASTRATKSGTSPAPTSWTTAAWSPRCGNGRVWPPPRT